MKIHTSDRVGLLEYMLLPLEDRLSHVMPESPCLELGCNSKETRALLAVFLNTTAEKLGTKAMLCHTCNNAGCSNPEHLYWGTARENILDRNRDCPEWVEKRAATILEKYGEDYYKKIGKSGGDKFASNLQSSLAQR